MLIHDSFESFVEEFVRPAREENPSHRRLDGRLTGGNLAVAGEFCHKGRIWKVHADSYFDRLLAAYDAAKEGADPFVEVSTKRGKSLALTDELQARTERSQFKYLYIYEKMTRKRH